ncbi:10814_t:CDS:2 [Entrophospora sp. SA101]|nr:10814_t:CDS:2 [Entrophospora sp. SA101]
MSPVKFVEEAVEYLRNVVIGKLQEAYHVKKKMECITVEYYRGGTPYLPPEAIEEIIQSRGTIKNACKEMVDKYGTSTHRIYEIWKRHAQGLPHGGKMKKISGGDTCEARTLTCLNNIPNTDIVAQIEREIKRRDKNLASSARIMSTT